MLAEAEAEVEVEEGDSMTAQFARFAPASMNATLVAQDQDSYGEILQDCCSETVARTSCQRSFGAVAVGVARRSKSAERNRIEEADELVW